MQIGCKRRCKSPNLALERTHAPYCKPMLHAEWCHRSGVVQVQDPPPPQKGASSQQLVGGWGGVLRIQTKGPRVKINRMLFRN